MPRDIAITGRLGNDPERFTTNNGKEMVGFRMAENHSYKDRDTGEWKNAQPEWYDVTCGSEELGDQAVENLRKGQKVTVEGNLRSKISTNRETGEPEVRQMMWANDLRPSLAANAAAAARSTETTGPESQLERSAELTEPQFETTQAQQQYQQAQESWAGINAQDTLAYEYGGNEQDTGWDR